MGPAGENRKIPHKCFLMQVSTDSQTRAEGEGESGDSGGKGGWGLGGRKENK